MLNVALPAAIVAIGTWIGAIVFHSAVVAPAVFAGLDEADARRFLRTIFPRFYALGLCCGVVALLALGAASLAAGWPGPFRLAVPLLAVMTVLQAVSLGLVPRINAARDAGAAGAALFSRLHRVSVLLTVIVLVLGVTVLAVIGGTLAG